MKITQCKYGHYYDKAYFAKCPHCYRKNGGRDEDIIIKDVKLTANLSDTNQITKTQDKKESDRENVKRWIGEAWDELEEILADEESELPSATTLTFPPAGTPKVIIPIMLLAFTFLFFTSTYTLLSYWLAI